LRRQFIFQRGDALLELFAVTAKLPSRVLQTGVGTQLL
jgi:hypothetical protein